MFTATPATLSETVIAVKESMKKKDMLIERNMMENGRMEMNLREILMLKRNPPNKHPKNNKPPTLSSATEF